MAVNSCTVCTCVQPNMSPEFFYQQNILVLCQILKALSGGGGGGDVNLVAVGGDPVVLGQAAMTASIPVVIASDQTGLSVAVTSVIPGVGPTNLGKAEDAGHVSGDTGVASWGVSNDPASITTFGAVGDYTPHAVHTNGAAFSLMDFRLQPTGSNGGIFGLMHQRDAASSGVGGTTDTMILLGGIRNDNRDGMSGTNYDYTPLSMTTQGAANVYLVGGPNIAASPMRTEDTALAGGDVLVVNGAQRQDTPANDTSNDGDAAFIKSNTVGALYVEPANQVATWAAATIAGAAGGITTAGANALTNSAKVKAVRLLNTTDQIVQLSLDAGTTWVMSAIALTGIAAFDLGENGRWTASNIHIRSIGSNTSAGSAYISVMI